MTLDMKSEALSEKMSYCILMRKFDCIDTGFDFLAIGKSYNTTSKLCFFVFSTRKASLSMQRKAMTMRTNIRMRRKFFFARWAKIGRGSWMCFLIRSLFATETIGRKEKCNKR